VAGTRYFSTLKAILDGAPERFPTPGEDDTPRPVKVDVPSCHASAVAILSSLEGSPALSPPFPSMECSEKKTSGTSGGAGGRSKEGKKGKRPRVSATQAKANQLSSAASAAAAGKGGSASTTPASKRPKVGDGRGASQARGWQQAKPSPGKVAVAYGG
ncbi:unnamed protein product, partial [Laminaria digitata]